MRSEVLRVRATRMEDLADLEVIFARAREFMRSQGNGGQWGDGSPSMGIVEEDICNGNSYCVVGEDGVVEATFALVFGDDPTYSVIYDGEWLNDRPYATIHRIASAGRVKGIGDFCFEWAIAKAGNVRLDTHQNNISMHRLAQKHGFVKCGIILVADGTERVAYQLPL